MTLAGSSSHLIHLPQLEVCKEIDTPGLWAIPAVTLLCHTTGQEGSQVGTEIRNLFSFSPFLCVREEIKKKSQLPLGNRSHPDNLKSICPALVLPFFCNCLLAGISLLIKPPIKISSKDNAGSSAASSARLCWSLGDIDESLSPGLSEGLSHRDSCSPWEEQPPGLGDVSPSQTADSKKPVLSAGNCETSR